MSPIRLGRRQTTTSKPAHTSGVHQGNAKGNYARQKGHHADGTSTAARSTGINPDLHGPIDPSMPNLSPG
jgi:hypothetical protein